MHFSKNIEKNPSKMLNSKSTLSRTPTILYICAQCINKTNTQFMKRLITKLLQLFFALYVVFTALNVNAQSLKKFKSEDVGNPALKGETQFVKSGVDIKAGGEDIWGNSDQYHFVSQQFTGDFDITVRLV